MRPLIVATSAVTAVQRSAHADGSGPQINYLTLAEKLGAPYVDYTSIPRAPMVGRIGNRLGLDLAEASHVARQIQTGVHDLVFSMSERVALPLTPLLGRSARQVVYGYHLLAERKIQAMRLVAAPAHWDHILVPTPAEADALRRRLGLSTEQISVGYNAVDTRFFAPLPAPDAAPTIFSLGVGQRDYPTLLRALLGLPHITAQLAVSSPWLHHQAAQAGVPLPANVQLLPQLGPSALRAHYAASRCVVLPIAPNTSHWSAATIPIMEAAAMGRAVIATRTPGTETYVRHGETGLLVPAGDPRALAQAIAELWDDPARAAAMGQAARAWALQTFALERWVARLNGLFAELLRVPLQFPADGSLL